MTVSIADAMYRSKSVRIYCNFKVYPRARAGLGHNVMYSRHETHAASARAHSAVSAARRRLPNASAHTLNRAS